MFIIKSLSEAEKEDRKRQHPMSEPKDWELMEGDIRIGYYDTKEEADAALAHLKRFDAIKEALEEMVNELADKFSMKPSEMEKIIKEALQ